MPVSGFSNNYKNKMGGRMYYLEEIGDKVSAQMRLGAFADVVSLQKVGNAVETAAGDCPPAQTLLESVMHIKA